MGRCGYGPQLGHPQAPKEVGRERHGSEHPRPIHFPHRSSELRNEEGPSGHNYLGSIPDLGANLATHVWGRPPALQPHLARSLRTPDGALRTLAPHSRIYFGVHFDVPGPRMENDHTDQIDH